MAIHPNGVGEVLGDSLVTEAPLYTSGTVWYVHSGTGDDTYAGDERRQPFATLAGANAEASVVDGDIVVLLDGHEETFTALLTISKKLTIVGSGQSNGKPTAKLTCNMAATSMFLISGADVELRNIWFEENAQANSAAKVRVTGTRFRMIGCYFECGGTDDNYSLLLNATTGDYEIRNTTFVSTSTTVATAPQPAVNVAQSTTRLIMEGVVFDGGTVGFAGGLAFEETGSVAKADYGGMSLLRGADVLMHDSTVGRVRTPTATGSARVTWAAGGA